MATQTPVNDLPDELFLIILEQLNTDELVRARRVCRYWRLFIDGEARADNSYIRKKLFLTRVPVSERRGNVAVVTPHPALPFLPWDHENASSFLVTLDLQALLAIDSSIWRWSLISQPPVTKVQFVRDVTCPRARMIERRLVLEHSVIEAPGGVTYADIVAVIRYGLDRLKQSVAADYGVTLDEVDGMFEGNDGLELLWKREGMKALKIKCLNAVSALD